MIQRLVLLCAGIVLLTTSVSGQDLPQNEQPVTRAEFKELMAMVNTLTTVQHESRSELAALRKRVDGISDLQLADRDELHQMSEKADGKRFVRFDTTHEPTKRELQRAITESSPTHGTVRIVNKMGTDQTFSLNGETHRVLAGDFIKLDVRMGEFSVRLPGQQAKSHFVGMPTNTTTVTIEPTRWVQPITTWRYISEPIYTPLYR